ncbi:MAG: hypothetical protein KC420_17045 [Myxococcales bacterium]|nr:hypothetical protein [Myxococcales bacterium]MCB9566365.1 hypothetical protein [Myxococcales bacterium]
MEIPFTFVIDATTRYQHFYLSTLRPWKSIVSRAQRRGFFASIRAKKYMNFRTCCWTFLDRRRRRWSRRIDADDATLTRASMRRAAPRFATTRRRDGATLARVDLVATIVASRSTAIVAR